MLRSALEVPLGKTALPEVDDLVEGTAGVVPTVEALFVVLVRIVN